MKETCAGGEVAAQGGCQNQAKAWVQAEKPWQEVMDRWGPRDSTVRKEESLGKWLMLEGGSTTPTVFTHRTQAAPSTRGPSFLLCSPKGRGISHPFFYPGCLDSRTVMSPQGPVGSWSGAKRERRTFQAEWASQRPCSWGSDLMGSFSAFQNFTFSIYLAVGHLENSLGIFLNGLHNADSCHLPLPWGPTFILITQSVLLLSTDSPPRPQTYPGSFSTDLFLPSPTCCLQFLLTL